jgi:hypothetical protein
MSGKEVSTPCPISAIGQRMVTVLSAAIITQAKITEVDLKKPAQFKLIGRKDIGRVDVPSKVNGTAI